MKYNKEDYLIALTIHRLEHLDHAILFPTEVLKYADNKVKASFVIDGDVLLIDAHKKQGDSFEYYFDIIFQNKEHVRLKDYQGKYAVNWETGHSRAFDLKPNIIEKLNNLVKVLLRE